MPMRITFPLRLLLAAALLAPGLARPASVEGMIVKPSGYTVAETIDRLRAVLEARGITIAVRWNHAARSEGTGAALRPMELLIFGNPALGSPLMAEAPTTGIDLPMKAIAWEDAEGNVWLGYNDPAYLARRHGIEHNDDVLKKMTKALDAMTGEAVQERANAAL